MSVSLKFEPHIKAYLSISLDIITVLAPSIPRFKGLGMRNLQYWIRICQTSHNTVTNYNNILQLHFTCGSNFNETDLTCSIWYALES